MKRFRKQILIVCIVGILIIASKALHLWAHFDTIYYDQAKPLGIIAVNRWHDQWNQGNFKEAYEEANPLAKSTISEDAFIRGLEIDRGDEGKVVKSTLVGWQVLNTGRINMYYDTQFEKRRAKETFGWQTETQGATLLRYILVPIGLTPTPVDNDSSDSDSR